MLKFLHPIWFLMLLPWAAAAWAVYSRRRREGLLFAPPGMLPPARRSWRIRLRAVLPALFLAGLLLLMGALARPQMVFARVMRSSDAVAIQLAMDISGSMEALDFSAGNQLRSRLEVVKATMADFIGRRTDDLIGLVTFGGFAVGRVPLTLDHQALAHVLQGVQVPKPQFNQQGQILNQEEMLTAIGDALAVASARLEKVDVKSRLIVLLSDGESNTGSVQPETAMQAAKALGIKIYTIGVGSTGLAPFRGRDIFGREAIQQAQVSMDEDLLRRLAETTGGVYYNVRNPRALEQAFTAIDLLERTPVQSEIYSRHDELYGWCLWPGLILLCLAMLGNVTLGRHLI